MAAIQIESSESLLVHVERQLSQGVSFGVIAEKLHLHRNSLQKRLEKEFGEEWKGVRNCSNLSVDTVCGLIKQYVPLSRHGSNWGSEHVRWLLRSKGLRIPKPKVAEALRILQPEQVERRSLLRLWRAVYDITEPMALWHMDSYDKISTWRFRIHGCIDGASHFVVYAMLATNKRKETIYSAYEATVFKYGHPLRIRSDYVAEHILVQRDTESARPNHGDVPSFLSDPVVNNQRIERFWRQLSEKFGFYYKAALLQLGEEGVLDMKISMHRTCLLKVFLPVLQTELAEWIHLWNSHKVRTMRESGRSIPGHVPSALFQNYERENGILQCHPYENPDYVFSRRVAYESGDSSQVVEDTDLLEGNLHDIQDTVFRGVCDNAYSRHSIHLVDIKTKFRFFLNLTVTCMQAEESGEGLKQYLDLVRFHTVITSSPDMLFTWKALYAEA